jgi:hypothetical protein
MTSQEAFEREYASWEVPLEPLDERLRAMNEESVKIHAIEVKKIYESKDFMLEVDQWKRDLYHRLALDAGLDESTRKGLQIALLSVNDFLKRLKLVASCTPHKPLRDLRSRL